MGQPICPSRTNDFFQATLLLNLSINSRNITMATDEFSSDFLSPTRRQIFILCCPTCFYITERTIHEMDAARRPININCPNCGKVFRDCRRPSYAPLKMYMSYLRCRYCKHVTMYSTLEGCRNCNTKWDGSQSPVWVLIASFEEVDMEQLINMWNRENRESRKKWMGRRRGHGRM